MINEKENFGGRSQEFYLMCNYMFIMSFSLSCNVCYTHRYTHFSKCMVQAY